MQVATPPKRPGRQGSRNINTATKARIAQHFVSLGGQKVRGAASKTARKFSICGLGGPSRIIRIAKQVAEGKIDEKRNTGKVSRFDESIEAAIVDAFATNDTSTS